MEAIHNEVTRRLSVERVEREKRKVQRKSPTTPREDKVTRKPSVGIGEGEKGEG